MNGHLLEPLNLLFLALIVRGGKASPGFQHTYLRCVLEAFCKQRDDGGINIVNGLTQLPNFRHTLSRGGIARHLCSVDGRVLPVTWIIV